MRTLLLALIAACAAPDAVTGDFGQAHDVGQRAPRASIALDNTAMVAVHMRGHFDDLRTIERMLIAGKLDDAKALAFLLATPANDRALARWDRERRRVTDAAIALHDAPTIDAAIDREARVAAACAACHVAAQDLPALPAAPAIAPDDGTQRTRMARHQWAVDRLWEGMIVPAAKPWRDGLVVLADTPLPADGSRTAALELQRRARAELDAPVPTDQRARVYHRLLVTCIECHAAQHVVIGM